MKLLVPYDTSSNCHNTDAEESDDHFLQFLKVLESWNIVHPTHCLMYSFINGVCSSFDHNDHTESLENTFGPELEDLSNLVNVIERNYVANLATEDEPDRHTAHIQAFRATFSDLAQHVDQEMPDTDTADWCGCLFHAGILAECSAMVTARDCIRKRNSYLFPAETFLFDYISNLMTGIPYMGVGSVMQQFLNFCYHRTPVERRVIAGEVFSEICDKLHNNNETLTLGRAFFEFQAAGIRIARERKDTRDALLEDIETSLGKGCVAANRNIFLRHLAPNPLELRPDEIWDGTRRLVSAERKISLELLNENPNNIIRYSYFQWMTDAAFWTGLYSAEPEAFERYL